MLWGEGKAHGGSIDQEGGAQQVLHGPGNIHRGWGLGKVYRGMQKVLQSKERHLGVCGLRRHIVGSPKQAAWVMEDAWGVQWVLHELGKASGEGHRSWEGLGRWHGPGRVHGCSFFPSPFPAGR